MSFFVGKMCIRIEKVSEMQHIFSISICLAKVWPVGHGPRMSFVYYYFFVRLRRMLIRVYFCLFRFIHLWPDAADQIKSDLEMSKRH